MNHIVPIHLPAFVRIARLAFCMGTCVEGDSAHPPSWMARPIRWTRHCCSWQRTIHFCPFIVLKWSLRKGTFIIFFLCCLGFRPNPPLAVTIVRRRTTPRRPSTESTEAKVSLSFLSSAVSTILVSALTSLRSFFLPGTERRGLDRS